jgi:Na+-driven multidrug efflux pump
MMRRCCRLDRAELAAVIFLVTYVWRNLAPLDFGLFKFSRFERRTAQLLGRLSLPIAAQCVLEDVRWFAFFLIIERVSTSALAVANIIFTCYLVFWISVEGFSEAACSLVSRFVGCNRTSH